MFTKKNHQPNQKTNTIESWITGKIASTLIGSAVCYALYKFGIYSKLKNYFKKSTPIFADNTHDNTHQGE